MFTVYTQRKKSYPAFISSKGEIIDDGTPKKIKLWANENEILVKIFLDNLKNGVRIKDFKFWMEDGRD